MSPFWMGAIGFMAGWASCAWLDFRRRKRQGRMLSFISHELNTPVTALNMTVLNFVSGVFGALPKEHEEWFRIMKDQVGGLNCMVGDLRDFIHLEFHRDFHLRLEAVDARELLEAAASLVAGSVERSGARLHVSSAEGLAPLRGDADRIARALGAVLSHARKFRAEGPIALRAEAAEGGVEYAVSFAGPRLGREEVARMLDLYYPVSREDSQLLCGVGTGLGICRLIAEAHGGRMAVTVDGAGATRIAVFLPALTVPAGLR